MNILFIGDSITQGTLGESYVDTIRTVSPDWALENLGRNGETFNVIFKRLLERLRKNDHPDLIVLQGGYNDLLLPYFNSRGGLFSFAYRQQLKQGMKPLNMESAQVEEQLSRSISEVKQLYKGKIILAAVGCVGENLGSPLNLQRDRLNAIVESIARKEGIAFANTAQHFNTILKGEEQSTYCLDSFWAVTLLDRFRSGLSARRGLYLTIDGVHLNGQGAQIFAQTVMDQINAVCFLRPAVCL